jgi:hypothetical protein
MKRWASPALLALALALLAGPGLAAGATQEIEVRSQATQNAFPQGMRFIIFLSSEDDIVEVRLRYRVQPAGNPVRTNAQCTPGRLAQCTAMVGHNQQSYIVPGAVIDYLWEARDAAGRTLETPEQRVVYQDDRFQWEPTSRGNVTVYTYSGSDQTVNAILDAALATLDEIGELLGTRIDFPVKVWVYATTRDLQPAVANRGGLGVTLGEVAAADTALVSRETLALSTVRHEIAHIVTRHATRSHIVDAPVWLNEGISVYAQKGLDQSQQQALSLAIRTNRVLPITSLTASTRAGSDLSLFYGQSGSIVTFMVERYGKEKMAALIAALRTNNEDGALREVYGFDRLGLENEWRRSVGLPPAEVSGGAGGGAAGPVPTFVPFGAGTQPGGVPTQAPATGGEAARQEDGGSGVSAAVVIGAVTAAVVVVLLAAGVYLSRRARPGAA